MDKLTIGRGRRMRAGFLCRCLAVLVGVLAGDAHSAAIDPVCREAWNHVRDEYYRPIDENVFLAACPSSLDSLLNRFSSLEQMMPQGKEGSLYFGAIGVEIAQRGDWPIVVEALEGTPADTAQIQRNDVILTIDGTSTQGMPLSEVAGNLRGKVDSAVRLNLLRDGKVLLPPPIIRRPIRIHSVIAKEVTPRYLWLRVKRFEARSVGDVEAAVLARWKDKNKPALGGLIFDFRGSPGGLLDSALALASAFLPDKVPLIRIQKRGTAEKEVLSNDPDEIVKSRRAQLPPEVRSLPLTVLIDGGTAAGPEIVAGIWQAYGKAVVVGAPSFGKNTIETAWIMQSKPDTYLRLTIATWTLPDGRSVRDGGLQPDVRLPGRSDAGLALATRTLNALQRFVEQELEPALRRVARLRGQHHCETALAVLDRILTAVPDCLPARYARANTLAELGRHAAARRDCDIYRGLVEGDDVKNLASLNCRTGVLTDDRRPLAAGPGVPSSKGTRDSRPTGIPPLNDAQ